MERRISIGIFQPKWVDHLQRWSRIFRSEETETDLSIWIPTEMSGIFGITGSSPGEPLVDQWNFLRAEGRSLLALIGAIIGL